MIEWMFILGFFGKKFFEGFLMGVMVRVFISILFRIDMTIGGVFRTGLFFGGAYTLLTFLVLQTMQV